MNHCTFVPGAPSTPHTRALPSAAGRRGGDLLSTAAATRTTGSTGPGRRGTSSTWSAPRSTHTRTPTATTGASGCGRRRAAGRRRLLPAHGGYVISPDGATRTGPRCWSSAPRCTATLGPGPRPPRRWHPHHRLLEARGDRLRRRL